MCCLSSQWYATCRDGNEPALHAAGVACTGSDVHTEVTVTLHIDCCDLKHINQILST